MTVSSQYLVEHLNDVLSALSSGEAVEVERPGGTTLRLTACEVSTPALKERVLGAGAGEMGSVSYEDWERIDREWKNEFADKFSGDS